MLKAATKRKKIGRIWILFFTLAILIGIGVGKYWNANRIFAVDDSSCANHLRNYCLYDDVDDLVVDYHEALNEEMNRRTELFLNAKPADLQALEELPPKIKDEKGEDTLEREPCKNKDATSTYCLSMLFVDEYAEFRKRMIELRDTEFVKAQTAAIQKAREKGAGANVDTDEIFEEVREMDFKIDEEIIFAEKAMELALAVYNEMHTAYPLHLKMEELAAALQEYSNKLGDVRRKVEFFPNTFFNVQTTKCT